MKTAGIAVLKSQLSEYLTAVKAGEEVCVTERGRPIARIVPIYPGDTDERVLGSLERAGLVKRPTASLDASFWDQDRGHDAEGAVRTSLTADREESR